MKNPLLSMATIAAVFVFAVPTLAQESYKLGPNPKPDVEGPEPYPTSRPGRPRLGPHREGFTIGVSLGAGVASFFGSQVREKSWWGLGGANLWLGGFVTPDLAVLFQINGVNFGPFNDAVSTGLVSVGGPAVQYWPHDMLSLMLGGGFSIVYLKDKYGQSLKKGGGSVTFQAMFYPLVLRHHALGLYVAVSPTFASGVKTVATHFGMEWQYF